MFMFLSDRVTLSTIRNFACDENRFHIAWAERAELF